MIDYCVVIICAERGDGCDDRSAAHHQAHQLVSRERGDLLGLHFHEGVPGQGLEGVFHFSRCHCWW